jgi:methyl-galactoside transport system substrate-binding protein
MKKFLALALVAMMALGMVSMASAEADPIKVGVCIYQFNDNFMTLYRNELQSYLETTYGAEVTIVDGKNDQAEQTNQINSFIAQGVDVLIINLVQSTAASTVIDLVEAAGIPTVFINREPSEEDMARFEGKITYVGADARQSGTYQGEIIVETANQGDFNGNGAVDYVMIMGDPENVDAQYRTEFSIKALTDAGLTVNKLFEQRGDWMQENGQQLAANALAQFGDEVDVIFCNNDAMALGAYQAIVSAGRVVNENIYLLGVDALEECVEMVKAGTMTGTVLNDHIGQSHQAADAAMLAASGEALEAYYWVDYQKVTAE